MNNSMPIQITPDLGLNLPSSAKSHSRFKNVSEFIWNKLTRPKGHAKTEDDAAKAKKPKRTLLSNLFENSKPKSNAKREQKNDELTMEKDIESIRVTIMDNSMMKSKIQAASRRNPRKPVKQSISSIMNMKPIEECKHETDSSIMNEKELNETKSTKKCADDFLSSNIQLIENELDLNFSKSDRSRYSYETNKLNSQDYGTSNHSSESTSSSFNSNIGLESLLNKSIFKEEASESSAKVKPACVSLATKSSYRTSTSSKKSANSITTSLFENNEDSSDLFANTSNYYKPLNKENEKQSLQRVLSPQFINNSNLSSSSVETSRSFMVKSPFSSFVSSSSSPTNKENVQCGDGKEKPKYGKNNHRVIIYDNNLIHKLVLNKSNRETPNDRCHSVFVSNSNNIRFPLKSSSNTASDYSLSKSYERIDNDELMRKYEKAIKAHNYDNNYKINFNRLSFNEDASQKQLINKTADPAKSSFIVEKPSTVKKLNYSKSLKINEHPNGSNGQSYNKHWMNRDKVATNKYIMESSKTDEPSWKELAFKKHNAWNQRILSETNQSNGGSNNY